MRPIPQLGYPVIVAPTRLRHAVGKLSNETSPARAFFTIEQAQELVRRRMLAPLRDPTPRRAIPALLQLLEHSTLSDAHRLSIINLILEAQSVSWRALLLAWQLTRGDRRIAAQLVDRLTRGFQQPRFRARVPAWLSKAVSVSDVLSNPVHYLCERLAARGLTLDELPRRWELAPRLVPLTYVYSRMLEPGAYPAWWASTSPARVQAWASAQGDSALTARLADRLLVDYPRARTEGDASQLLLWILEKMGEPEKRPGLWSEVSKAGRDEFERLYLARELDRILAEFKKQSSDTDRAEYWGYRFQQSSVADARYYLARGGVAVCMMCIKGQLIIEFGDTGNACYFYSLPPNAPRLRSLSIPEKGDHKAFKSTWAVTLGGTQFPYVRKLSHTRGVWMSKFDDHLM